MSEYKTIHLTAFNPRQPKLFKTTSTDRASVTVIQCNNSDNCGLYAKGECCLSPTFLGSCRCPYGKIQRFEGPTKRAKKCTQWVNEHLNKFGGKINSLKLPTKKLATIGDYIYIPYNHVTMNENIKTLSHSSFFVSGTPFIHKSDWNAETIKSIIEFIPLALFPALNGSREIINYQKEEIPKFLLHLLEEFPDLFKKVEKLIPDLKEKYNINKLSYVGRKAYLLTLNSNFTFTTKDNKYPVTWEWNGKELITNSEHVYSKIWGEVKEYDKIETKITPNKETTIIVQNESWINSNTKFAD